MSRSATHLMREAEQLVGMDYVDGRFDCAHYAVLVQQRLWGRTVHLPLGGARHPRGARSQVAAINRHRDELAERVVGEPQSGDAILFQEDDEDGRDWHWHIGTLLVRWTGERWVLHLPAYGTSVLQRVSDCQRRGLRVEGYYRWRPTEAGQA